MPSWVRSLHSFVQVFDKSNGEQRRRSNTMQHQCFCVAAGPGVVIEECSHFSPACVPTQVEDPWSTCVQTDKFIPRSRQGRQVPGFRRPCWWRKPSPDVIGGVGCLDSMTLLPPQLSCTWSTFVQMDRFLLPVGFQVMPCFSTGHRPIPVLLPHLHPAFTRRHGRPRRPLRHPLPSGACNIR